MDSDYSSQILIGSCLTNSRNKSEEQGVLMLVHSGLVHEVFMWASTVAKSYFSGVTTQCLFLC